MEHLIVFSHLRWNFVWQRPQHLLSRLGRRWRVVFVEEPMTGTESDHLERLAPCAGVQAIHAEALAQRVARTSWEATALAMGHLITQAGQAHRVLERDGALTGQEAARAVAR